MQKHPFSDVSVKFSKTHRKTLPSCPFLSKVVGLDLQDTLGKLHLKAETMNF